MEDKRGLIFYIDNNLIASFKPAGLPTVPLKKDAQKDTLLNRLSAIYPEVLSPWSEHFWEGTAIHRLDTATSGLVLFARTQFFYHYLVDIQKQNLITKTYSAVCDYIKTDNNFTGMFQQTEKPFLFESYFRSYGKKGMKVKPVFSEKKSDNGKKYCTEIYPLKTYQQKTENNKYSFFCKITQGFRHQIRSHLAYIGFPIVNDELYNPNYVLNTNSEDSELKLCCVKVRFPLPSSDSKNKKTNFLEINTLT